MYKMRFNIDEMRNTTFPWVFNGKKNSIIRMAPLIPWKWTHSTHTHRDIQWRTKVPNLTNKSYVTLRTYCARTQTHNSNRWNTQSSNSKRRGKSEGIFIRRLHFPRGLRPHYNLSSIVEKPALSWKIFNRHYFHSHDWFFSLF